MNSKRSQMPLVVDSIENFIFEASVSQENEHNLLSIKAPTTKGLLMMVEDGSFDKLWKEYNYILKVDLNNRRIIWIENKFLSSVVPLDDPRFWYNP